MTGTPSPAPADIPSETWDCHVHVFDPKRFPYAERRDYTPGPAPLDTLRDRLRRESVANALLVQPSVHGTDNSCLLHALRELGSQGRAIAVIDVDAVMDEELADLQAAGVVGMRVNLVGSQASQDADPFHKMSRRLQGSGMFLQIFAPLERILRQSATLETAGIPVVLDHFAGTKATDDAERLNALERLCRNAPLWIKLSADYRLADDPATQTRMAQDLIGRFWATMPDRLIWGSDWPHTGGGADRKARPISQTEPFRQVDTLSVPRLLVRAGLDPQARRQILAINPPKLFGESHNADAAPRSGHGGKENQST